MGCGSCCVKAILIIVNIFFLLFSLIFLAIGIVIKIGGTYVQPYIDKFLESVPDISQGAGVGDESVSTAVFSAEEVLAYLDGLAVGLIVFGVIMFVLACLGCCGACCTVKVMLIIYIICLALLALIQGALLGALYTGKFSGKIRGFLETTIEKYEGFDSFGAESVAWNYVMIEHECCGIDGYEDFNKSVNWQRRREFTRGDITFTYDLLTPISCCKMEGSFPSVKPLDENCAVFPNDLINNWKTSCWDEVSKEMESFKGMLVGGCSGVIVLEVILVIMAIFVLATKDSKVDVV